MLALLHFDTFCRYGDCRSASSARKYFFEYIQIQTSMIAAGSTRLYKIGLGLGKATLARHFLPLVLDDHITYIYIYIRIHNVWEKNLFHNSFVVAVFLWMTSQDASSLVPRAQAAKLHCWASSVWLSNLVPTELNSGYLQSGFWNSANTEEYGNPWKS